ncbi:hypothetical protein LJB42_003541 [Komagataella kurtzmanii]|nr:hypothetical protein LJB42_003541 [Komagataella kurtzmanii]
MADNTKKRRLSNDVIGQLQDDLKQSPLNVNTWDTLIDKVIAKDKHEQVIQVFEDCLVYFSYLGYFWNRYATYLLERLEFDKTKEIFNRCLPKVANVELWRSYIRYVRRTNSIITGGEEARRLIIKSFEISLENIGMDYNSDVLYDDYIEFLNEWQPINPNERNHRNDLLRGLYRSLIKSPIKDLERYWTDYTNFENEANPNKQISRKLVNEVSGEYMNTRIKLSDLVNKIKGIPKADRYLMNNEFDFSKVGSLSLVIAWSEWERTNPFNLEKNVVKKRVNLSFQKSLQLYPFIPKLWYNYFTYLMDQQQDPSTEATNGEFNQAQQAQELIVTVKQAISLNPTSFILTTLLSDLLQSDGKDVDTIKKVYLDLIEALQKYYNTDQVEDSIVNRSITEAYILLMNMLKSSKDGRSEIRKVFSQARKFENLTYHCYVQNAYLEYYTFNDVKVAKKIFDLAFKKFNDNISFLNYYLNFVISIKDFSQAKVVYETFIKSNQDSLDREKLFKVYQSFMQFESQFGDPISLRNLEKRLSNQFGLDSLYLAMINRLSPFCSPSNLLELEPPFNSVKQIDEKQGSLDSILSTPVSASTSIEDPTNRPKNGPKKQKIDDNLVIKDDIYNLLRILPKKTFFKDVPILNEKLVEVLTSLNL